MSRKVEDNLHAQFEGRDTKTPTSIHISAGFARPTRASADRGLSAN